jgi:hypothetical protein
LRRRSNRVYFWLLGLLSKAQAREEGLLGRERLGRVPYGYTTSGRACIRSPRGANRWSRRLCLSCSARRLTAGLGSRLLLVRGLLRLRCLGGPLLRLRCLGGPLLLRRRCLLLLGLGGLRRRRLLLLDRRRTWRRDRRTAGGWLWTGLLALTVWTRRLAALDLGSRGVVGCAGWRPVLRAVVPGLILRTGSSRALWTRRAGALR